MSPSTSRLFLTGLALAAGLTGCTDTKSIETPIPAGMRPGRIELNPDFSQSARTIAASLGDFGLTYDRVRIIVRNNPDTAAVVVDTTIAFGPTSNSLTLSLTVPVNIKGQLFNTRVQYAGPSGVLYAGAVLVKSYVPGEAAPEQAPLLLNFEGPGAKVKTITISPDPMQLVGATTTPVTVTATDSSGEATTVPPLIFTSSDASLATISTTTSGRLVQSFGKRGTAILTAATPTGISGTLSATVTLPAASITLVSGGSQNGTVGAALASPAVVQVNAEDGAGVPGVAVTFAAPIGGAIGTASATTDANGRASTTMTLATTTGAQNFLATAAGFNVPIPAIASTGPASPATSTLMASVASIKADNATSATITLQTKDQYGNTINGGGAVVRLTTSLGHFGSIGAVTTIDATDLGNGKYSAQLFASRPGTATITAAIGGTPISTQASTVGVAAIPAGAIMLSSGGGQNGAVGTTLTAPAVVQVNSADGVGLPDVAVTFTPPSGASVGTVTVATDANGRASSTLTLGTGVGTQNFTATAAGFSVTIPAIAVAGPALAATSTIAASPLSIRADNAAPAMITVQTRDQYGNVIVGGGATVTLTTNLGHFGSIGAVTTVNATDLGNGTYTAQLFSSRSGTATITGTVAGAAITTPAATVKVTALPPASIILVSGGEQKGTVGTTLTAPAVVMVKSAAGFPLPDVSVTFSAPTGASVGTMTATTDAGGRASSTLTLGTGPGAQNFGAIVANLSVTIPEDAVVGPASPAMSTISANVAQINADNATPAVITVHARDQYGNVIANGGATVTLTTSLGHWSGGAATTTTATDGDNGSYTATLMSAQSGTITIGGAIGGTAITTPSVTIAAIPTVVDHFDVTLANGSPISGNQPSGVATSVKVTARDVSGNIVTGYHGQPIISITNSTLVGGTPTIVAPAAVSGVSAVTVKFGAIGSNVTLDATDGTKVGHSTTFTVVASPAVAIVPSDGDSTIVYQLGQTPSRYPILTVIDGLGNRVANQTTTLAVTPPCTLQASQLTTNAQGMIVLGASNLTIPTTATTSAFSCELVATAVGFTAPPLRMALVARPTGSTVWTGHIDDKWETRDNWALELPSASLSAFIAAAQSSTSASYPVVRSSPTTLSIDVEDRARVNLNGNTLTVLRDIDARTTGVISNGTIAVPAGANGGVMRGSLPNVNCQSGQHSLSGSTRITGQLTLGSCSLDLAGKDILISGNFSTTAGAGLVMNQSASAMQIAGAASFGGAMNQLTAGTLSVLGNFSQSGTGTFAPTGTHAVTLAPTGQNQTVTFTDVTNSWFENLNVMLAAGRTVTINSPVKILGGFTVSSTAGGTLALRVGLANRLNGPITVGGTMELQLGGVVNTSSLTLGHGTVTVTGDGVLAAVGALKLDDNLHLTVNATGTLIGSVPQCSHGNNVVIDGSNAQAVATLKQLCGLP